MMKSFKCFYPKTFMFLTSLEKDDFLLILINLSLYFTTTFKQQLQTGTMETTFNTGSNFT